MQSYNEINVNQIERTEHPDGTGDLVVAKKEQRDSDGDKRIVDVKFVGIPDVRAVEGIIQGAFGKRG